MSPTSNQALVRTGIDTATNETSPAGGTGLVGRPRRTRLDPRARREQIVSAAASVFSERDPGDVTFEQIADAAGVSRALVYNYFGDRGGLLAAVYLRSFEQLDVALAASFESTPAGPERLRAIISAYLDFAQEHRGACQLISTAEATIHPLLRAARRRRFERMADGWGRTPEARLLSRGILSVLEGAAFEWLDDGGCDRERTEAVLYALLWSGLSGLNNHGIELPR